MKSNKKYIVLICLLFGIYAVVEFMQPQPIDWSPTYYNDKKGPYNLRILYECLPIVFDKGKVQTIRTPLYNVSEVTKDENFNYININSYFAADANDIEKLLNVVENGGTAFIAAQDFATDRADSTLPTDLGFKMYDGPRSNNIYTDTVLVQYNCEVINDNEKYRFETSAGYKYFELNNETRGEVIATDSLGNAIMVCIQYGEGEIFLHSLPIVFTNYNLMEPALRNFAFKCLRMMPNQNVYYDEYYKRGREGEDSILRAVMANKSLKWGYYIAIFGLCWFILFQSKRKQRIIPIMKPPSNTSVEFARSISQLYLRNLDHRNIAVKKIDYLLESMREKYRINTNNINNELLQDIANRSGSSFSEINDLFKLINFIKYSEKIDNQHLMELNMRIQNFVTKTKHK